MLIADRQRKVVLLDRAAEKIFAGALRVWGPLPHLRPALRAAPERRRHGAPGPLPEPGREPESRPHPAQGGLGQQHSPDRHRQPHQCPGEDPAGCLVVLREHKELLAHPVVQLQIATLAASWRIFPSPFSW